jgi:hypothetical protein
MIEFVSIGVSNFDWLPAFVAVVPQNSYVSNWMHQTDVCSKFGIRCRFVNLLFALLKLIVKLLRLVFRVIACHALLNFYF